MLVDTEYYMYPLRLEAPPILKDFGQLLNAMAKKTSGKKPSIRHGGRRRFRPGPKPNSSKSKDQPIEPFCMDIFLKQQNEKIITSHLKGTETEKKIRAFHGWKSLHEGLKKCCSRACVLVKLVGRELLLNRLWQIGVPIQNRKYFLGILYRIQNEIGLGVQGIIAKKPCLGSTHKFH